MSRVLYLSPGVFDKGGISRYARYQIRALRALLGDEAVRVLSLLPPDARALEEPLAVDFASFGLSRAGKSLFVAAAMAAALERRPKIVWSAHIHLAPLALTIARALGAKAVLNTYAAELWTHLTRVRREALGRVDRVISDCENSRRYMADNGLRAAERVVVHWDCVDLDRFAPGDPGDVLARHGVPPSDELTILTLGRMTERTEYKGYGRLLTVLASLPREARVRVVMGGDGEQRPVLAAQARALGLEGRVFFTGSVHERDLADLYRAGDVFSLVTSAGLGMGEGIPLTPLEAAASGKPILVGDQDGSHEAVEDGVTGFVVPTFDPAAHADRILRLVHDRELRARMGAAGRARMEREHGFPRFQSRVGEVLASLGG